MITITFGEIREGMFPVALAKLMSHNFKDRHAGYRIARLGKRIKTESETVNEQFMKMVKGYAVLDDKGGFVPRSEDPRDLHTFKIDPAKLADWEEALKGFVDLTVDINRFKIPIKWIIDEPDLKISPADMMSLEPILTEEEVDPQEQKRRDVEIQIEAQKQERRKDELAAKRKAAEEAKNAEA